LRKLVDIRTMPSIAVQMGALGISCSELHRVPDLGKQVRSEAIVRRAITVTLAIVKSQNSLNFFTIKLTPIISFLKYSKVFFLIVQKFLGQKCSVAFLVLTWRLVDGLFQSLQRNVLMALK